MGDDVVIRPYRSDDLGALYDVCLRTGAAGGDATDLMDDPTLLGDLYAAPYGVLEPASAFVVEDGEGVGGYCVGALDTAAFHARLAAEWSPEARRRHPARPPTDRLDDLFLHLLHHPPPDDVELLAAYPSHLHIDLLPRLQGRGAGRRLMQTFLDSLARRGSRGVHFGVAAANLAALGFYRHLGFEEASADGVVVRFTRAL